MTLCINLIYSSLTPKNSKRKYLVDPELKQHIQDFLANYVAITGVNAYGGVIHELSRGYAWNLCYHFYQSNFERLTAEKPEQNLILYLEDKQPSHKATS